MKVLCDVHIAKKVVRFFRENGIESIHVNDILDSWHTKDGVISKYADENDFTLMTKDSDFKDSHFLKSSPRRLLRISLGNISTNRLIKILGDNLELLKKKLELEKCYVEIRSGAIIVIEM